jgi:hypothetical protein
VCVNAHIEPTQVYPGSSESLLLEASFTELQFFETPRSARGTFYPKLHGEGRNLDEIVNV